MARFFGCCDHCDHGINEPPHDIPCPEGCRDDDDDYWTAQEEAIMTETARPTRTALAAKEFMDAISADGYQQAIEIAAKLGGWYGADRFRSMRNAKVVSDMIAEGALAHIMDLFRTWATEAEGPPRSLSRDRARNRNEPGA